MLKNYVKIAWRNITRHKTYTLINVLGLAFGISSCILIYLITSFEFSFDRFHPGGNRIYRIVGEYQHVNGEKEFLNSIVPDLAGIQNDIPGFEAKAGIIFYSGKISVPSTNGSSKDFDSRNDVVVTWPDYFKIFKYRWLAGNKSTALTKPYELVITESNARKYFGDLTMAEIIGKTIIFNDSLRVSISGIIKDWSGNTDLPYKDFISIYTISNSFLQKTISSDDWRSLGPHRSMVFVKLNKKTSADQVNAELAKYLKEHVKPSDYGKLTQLKLQSLSDLHFTNEYHRGDDGDDFRKAYLPTLYALMGLALFILLIAIINFVNLSTAQSIQRSKEVGIRKVLGSSRRRVMFQFFIETFLLTFLAICVAVWLLDPLLILFRAYIPLGVKLDLLNPSTIVFLLVLLLVTSIIAGFYPAKVLSSYLPVLSLKAVPVFGGRGKINLRKALIVFQFTISLILIIGAIVISRQIGFMYKTNKGFNSHNVVTIFNWGNNSGKMRVLLDKVKQISGVDDAILEGTPPMGFAQSTAVFKYRSNNESAIQVSTKMGDENFIPFYQMKLICGRNIIQSDSLKELVINQACAEALGFSKPEEAVGEFLYSNENKAYPIVGVVKNFQMSSFHERIQPAVIGHMPQWETNLALRLTGNGDSANKDNSTISQIEKKWKELYPQTGFNYVDLNTYIDGLFEKDEQTAWLVNTAMIIAIFISCMGLFGLAMFTSERRTKEIGIRRTLGASIPGIIFMLTKEFSKWVLLANLIAWPIAYVVMHDWLNDFAYKINIGLGVFLLAAIIALSIAILTVSYHAIKAATANPVKSLRYE